MTNQQLYVRWNDVYSELFTAHNGVRQGGILSPYLFNIYVNEISLELNKQDIGCTFQNCQINHLLYADDLVLISPSSKGLQQLINCCTYVGNNLNIIFNDSKTVCMTICNTSFRKCKTPFPDMYMNDQQLNNVDVFKYLGHYISSDLSDDKDIMRQTKLNYVRGNMLRQKFKFCSDYIECTLFKAYMYNMYTISLWSQYSKTVYRRLVTSYNNSFRFLFNYPKFYSASTMFVSHNVKSFIECLRTSYYSLFSRMPEVENNLLQSFLKSIHSKKSKLISRWVKCIYTK